VCDPAHKAGSNLSKVSLRMQMEPAIGVLRIDLTLGPDPNYRERTAGLAGSADTVVHRVFCNACA
jgi:hypothetical protein